jgi:uncharacterized sulfatase
MRAPCAVLARGALLGLGLLAARAAERPNFVLFLADDLTWHDVACFGGPTDARTPHLDRLAREGARLTRFYASGAVCAPVRQELLTGLHPVRSGAYPNHSVVRPGTRTLPDYFRAAGYRTGRFGKQHFGPDEAYPFDQAVGTLPEAHPAGPRPAIGSVDSEDDGDLDFAAIGAFFTAGPEPFVALVAPHEPHAAWTKGDRTPFPPARLQVPPYLVDTPEMRAALSAYYAEVAVLDAAVGRVLRLLEASGRAGTTLFLFCSEQGSGVPFAKWTLYDPGIRVAAIARWPGRIAPGTEIGALMQYADVLPTLLAAAGLATEVDTGCPDATGNRGFDGRSFLPALLGQTARGRDYAFAQHTTRGIIRGPEAYASRAVLDGRWKLILNLHADEEFSNGLIGGALFESWRRERGPFARSRVERYVRRPRTELYDLVTDPWELRDLAEEPGAAGVRDRLETRLAAWMVQQGDRGDATEREAERHQSRRPAPR